MTRKGHSLLCDILTPVIQSPQHPKPYLLHTTMPPNPRTRLLQWFFTILCFLQSPERYRTTYHRPFSQRQQWRVSATRRLCQHPSHGGGLAEPRPFGGRLALFSLLVSFPETESDRDLVNELELTLSFPGSFYLYGMRPEALEKESKEEPSSRSSPSSSFSASSQSS